MKPGLRTRRRSVLTATMIVGAGIALILGVTIIATGATTSRSASAASYCGAARSVDDYRGDQRAHLVSLLEQVQRLAPTEIRPVVATMRRSDLSSPAFRAARTAWGRFNTNHCCSCIGGPNVPQVASTSR